MGSVPAGVPTIERNDVEESKAQALLRAFIDRQRAYLVTLRGVLDGSLSEAEALRISEEAEADVRALGELASEQILEHSRTGGAIH